MPDQKGIPMLFNSFGYAVFLPVIFLLHWITPRKWRWALLLAASCFFYASWGPEYLTVLFLTIVVSYCAALYMEHAGNRNRKKSDRSKNDRPTGSQSKSSRSNSSRPQCSRTAPASRTALILSVLFCAGLLFFFKYLNFFSENVALLLRSLSIPVQPLTLRLALPIGISFYLFQTISYLVDVYQGKIPAERHFGIYAVYISYFPKVMQGPIERGASLLPQLHKPGRFHYEQASYGMKLMAWGFFKKRLRTPTKSL